MTKNIQTIDKILAWGLASLVFLLPLFFLPLTANFYEFNKQALLLVFLGLLLLLWSLRLILSQTVKIKITVFDLPVLLFAASFLLSTVIQVSNKSAALLEPGATGTILLLTLFYFLLANLLGENSPALVLKSFLASAVLLSLTALYQFSGLGQNLAPAEWLKPQFFTPAGGLLPLATFLGVGLTFALTQIETNRKTNKHEYSLYLYLFISLLILAGLAVALYQLTTSLRPLLLPPTVGWQIALETLKVSPFWGVGPTLFLSAFTQFKPLALNQTNLWAVWFSVSSNFYFQLLTTVGALGLATFLFLGWRIVRETMKVKDSLTLGLLVSLVLLALLPANFLLLFVFYLLLGCLAARLPGQEYEEKSRLLPWIVALPLASLLAFAFFFFGQAWRAEYYFKKSLEALGQNQGTQAYNLQVQALSLNPNQPQIRTAYSQTNFALANALSQQKDLSDQDRQNISILIQQAIREAKAAVALAPQNITYWENLALTYRRLINFAQGADAWTIAAYNQAISLDPLNPNLRLSQGGVYYSLNRWEEATRLFEQAVALKPDFANGWYNLAAAYREKDEFEKAVSAMEETLRLVPPDSEDWGKANSELEALKKRLAEKAEKEGKKPTETLSPPEPLPEGVKPPLTLPTGVEPEITPTP